MYISVCVLVLFCSWQQQLMGFVALLDPLLFGSELPFGASELKSCGRFPRRKAFPIRYSFKEVICTDCTDMDVYIDE